MKVLIPSFYADTNYVDAFILIHRYFLKSHELVDKLAKMYATLNSMFVVFHSETEIEINIGSKPIIQQSAERMFGT